MNDVWKATPSTPSGPITPETLDAAMKHVLAQGSYPDHRCDLDGHVALLGSPRCAHCHATIRELTLDEDNLMRDLASHWPHAREQRLPPVAHRGGGL